MCSKFAPEMDRQITTLRELFLDSTERFAQEKLSWQTDGKQSYTYASFRTACELLSETMTQAGIGSGKKVAILSQSMPNWTLAMFSIVAYGRVAIPLLPDFTENEVTNVLSHSESNAIFVSRKLMSKLSQECMDRLDMIIDIETLQPIKMPEVIREEDCRTSEPKADDLATIIYTSGTTGSAKGVMLSHRNFCANLVIGEHYHRIGVGDVLLSVLPMAHTYELSLGAFYPFYSGSAVCYMSKLPTPSILLSVMKKERPTAILTVPLIIEKIYKSSIMPLIVKNRVLKWMYRHMHNLTCRIIGRRLISMFGGRLKFFGIGGAKLNPDVEAFLKKAHFPYYIGYGLTECAPLLILSKWHSTVPGAIGYPGKGVSIRLDDADPVTGIGEIVAKGDNIMLGYYKDEERTKLAFTEDGWFRTNDLAQADEAGRYFIKGRLNNMILGASGENIYPEEIEKVINDFAGVNESLVMEREGHLLALVNFNEDVFDWTMIDDESFIHKIEERKKELTEFVNRRVNKNSQIKIVGVMREPFEKTATKKIRRFIYKDKKPDA